MDIDTTPSKLNIKKKLILIFVIISLGLLFSGIVSYILIQNVRVDGVYYNKLIRSKDLIADIYPPPAFIMESYLLAFEEFAEKDPVQRAALITKNREAQKKYYDVHAKWLTILPDGYLKQLLVTKSNDVVHQYYSIWENQFLPAIEQGKRDQAYEILVGPLSEAYHLHKEVIEEVVSLASDDYQKLRKEATDFYSKARVAAWGGWLLTLILSGWLISTILSALIRKLHTVTQGLERVSLQINTTANQQTESTAKQSISVQETTETLDQLNDSFQTTQSIAQESSDRAKDALKMSEEGNIQLKKMVDHLSTHREKVSQILEHILHLGQLTRQIHSIAALTSNLTNQTNILALNAAVQAAHVKQYGEGFSVIAAEIRKLGDESRKFLSHIDSLSDTIEEATSSTISIVEQGNLTIQEVIELAQSTTRAFDSIMSLTNYSVEGAEKTSSNVKRQGTAVHRLLKTMEELNRVSHENLKGMQQIRFEISKLDDLSQQLKRDI